MSRHRCTARRQGVAPAYAPCCLASSTTLAPVSPLNLWRATSPTMSPADVTGSMAWCTRTVMLTGSTPWCMGDRMLLRCHGRCSSLDSCKRMNVI
ncbi:hypothetical protein BDA96_01G333400 [Sorghum bicolor]|uniref:Uncharacterized protein n=1 Tax=Sorghum bicolor TaxID=4558 RepID=A0A921S300_SORBI|nr:hypothetical protein BDA96_01G333400 [Sorghum bicolor]